MRTLSVCALFVVFPASAMAWESTTEEVQFHSKTDLYRGAGYSGFLPSQDSVVSIEFSADTEATLQIDMTSDSTVAGEGTELTHTWQGIVGAGKQRLETETELAAKVHVDVWGYRFTAPVWDTFVAWNGEATFDSLLLFGDGSSFSTVFVDGTDLVDLSYEIETFDGVWIVLGGQITPQSSVILSGDRVVTNGAQADHRNEAVVIPTPDENPGQMTVQGTWTGNADASFGLDLQPSVGVCVDDFGCLDVPFHYQWLLEQSSRELNASTGAVVHELPAIDVAISTLNLGRVEVGDANSVDLRVEDLGGVELEGVASIDGDFFSLVSDEFSATQGDDGILTVVFEPEEEGQFVGEITIETNDPVNPTITVPVRGEGFVVEPPAEDDDEEPAEDDDDTDVVEYDGFDEEPSNGAAKGCGCSGLGANPAGLGAMLVGLVGLLVRRRK